MAAGTPRAAGEAHRTAGPTDGRWERWSVIGLFAGMAAAALALLVLNRNFVFYNDEWMWLAFSRDYEPETILNPHNSHLIAVPRLLYGTLPRVFGLEYLPFRLLAVIAVLVCAGLLFVLLRRRIGGPAALAPAFVLMLFGSAWNVVLAPIGIPFLFSIAGGLGALVAIERGDRRGDLLALAALLFGVASHTFGVIFAAGIGGYLLSRQGGWRRAWVAAIPLVLFAIWWLWARQFDQGLTDASNIPGIPVFVAEALAAVLASMAGLDITPRGTPFDRVFGGEPADAVLGLVLAALAVGALVLAVRRGASSRWLWAYIGMALLFWVGIALSEGFGRQPNTSRYLFFGAIIVLLIAAEALRGRRVGPRGLAAIYLVAAVALVGNLVQLRDQQQFLLQYTTDARAQLAMFELAGPDGRPTITPRELQPRGTQHIPINAENYGELAERFEPLGYGPAALERQSAQVRADADFVLAQSLGLLVVPAPPNARRRDCAVHEPEAGAPARFPLVSGPNLLRLRRPGSAPLSLQRLGETATVPAGPVVGDGYSLLALPESEAGLGWSGAIPEPVRVCSG